MEKVAKFEKVSFEERIATASIGHIKVTVECRNYVERKDKPPQEFFDRFKNGMQKRGGRQ